MVVDYHNEAELVSHLAGIELLISIVPGNDQLILIDAALKARVSRFIPAEFGPPLGKRSQLLDRGQRTALNRLRQHAGEGMEYTVFSPGIFYERFSPHGLTRSNIGHTLGANEEGDYLIDIRKMKADVPYDTSEKPAMVCMTSLQDTAQFIVAALALPLSDWPAEFRMRGERMNVSEIVRIAECLTG